MNCCGAGVVQSCRTVTDEGELQEEGVIAARAVFVLRKSNRGRRFFQKIFPFSGVVKIEVENILG